MPPGDSGRWYGQVKWFKDSKGYGFICIMGRVSDDAGDSIVGKEIFVHHSDVHPSVSTYKTLVKGEYVSFCLKRVYRPRVNGDEVELQAADVRGAYGGALMCDGLNVGALSRTSDQITPTVLHNGDIMFSPADDIIL